MHIENNTINITKLKLPDVRNNYFLRDDGTF